MRTSEEQKNEKIKKMTNRKNDKILECIVSISNSQNQKKSKKRIRKQREIKTGQEFLFTFKAEKELDD